MHSLWAVYLLCDIPQSCRIYARCFSSAERFSGGAHSKPQKSVAAVPPPNTPVQKLPSMEDLFLIFSVVGMGAEFGMSGVGGAGVCSAGGIGLAGGWQAFVGCGQRKQIIICT